MQGKKPKLYNLPALSITLAESVPLRLGGIKLKN